MLRTRAVYSIVQYAHDPGRGEAANVGVLLSVPSTGELFVRMSPTLARVKKFFGPSPDDLQRIASGVAALEYRLKLAEGEFAKEDDLARFAAARADAVRITTPRLMMVGDLTADLDVLYEELVGDHDRSASRAAKHRLFPARLDEVFKRLTAVGRAWRPGMITVPTNGRRLKVAAAYQNGVTNFVRAESLASGEMEKLERAGLNGRLIGTHKINGEKAQLVVVSADPAVRTDTEARFEKTLVEFGVRFIPHAAADAFADEVERTAH